jgi:GNAT superfamily N-acetyltransferase
MTDLIEVTDSHGRVLHADWLAKSESVHAQLRTFKEPYAQVMARVFAGGGRLRIAVEGGRVTGVAVFRVYENTFAQGPLMYVDDLVTDATQRSKGVGRALLASLEATAREMGVRVFDLDSGTQRKRAHAFYLRERMEISAFHFTKHLADDVTPMKG